LGDVEFLAENAYRFANPKRNATRFGDFSTIYSAGLFDYIPSDRLSTLIAALYQSLGTGGMLIAPLKGCGSAIEQVTGGHAATFTAVRRVA
jgi:hypothetical protein